MSLYTLSPFESGSGRRRKRCFTHSLPPNLVLEEKKKGEKKEDYPAAERCLTHKLPLNLVLEEEKETEKEKEKKKRLFL